MMCYQGEKRTVRGTSEREGGNCDGNGDGREDECADEHESRDWGENGRENRDEVEGERENGNLRRVCCGNKGLRWDRSWVGRRDKAGVANE